MNDVPESDEPAADSGEFLAGDVQNIDRRDGERATVEAEVEMTSFAKFIGSAVDISTGGLFVETHETLAVGDQLNLEMWIPEAGTFIAVPGEVRWHQPPEESGGSDLNGYGLQFVDVGPEMQERLEEVVDECRDEADTD